MAVPSSDRISLLPDSLLEDILARLPLQEVVRTSVLSKRWIPLWTQLPKIVLDKSFCTDLVRNDKDRLVQIITNIVVRSRKPIIDFTFSLNGVSSFDIDQIVNYVCDNGVEYFKLDIPNEKIFRLSSFDQLRLVKHLSLESCLIEVPCEFRGFTMLTYLKFYNVDIDGGELSSLVSSCPLLETVALENLRCCNYLVLSSPKLRVFRCEGFYLDVCLESTPRLEEMTVSVYDTEYDVEVDSDGPACIVVPFKVIPAIKYLALDGSFLMYMNLGMQQKNSRCQNVLNHLKLIKLTDVPLELIEVSQNVFSLIRRSPNLDTIVVTTCTEHTDSDEGVRVWQTENLSDVSLTVLREVYLLNITNKLSELLFIEMLVAKSPMLKAVVFRLYDGLNKEEGLRLGEKIRQFRRASSKVNFFEVDPQSEVDFQGYLL